MNDLKILGIFQNCSSGIQIPYKTGNNPFGIDVYYIMYLLPRGSFEDI